MSTIKEPTSSNIKHTTDKKPIVTKAKWRTPGRGFFIGSLAFLAGAGVTSLYFFYHYYMFMVRSDIEYKREMDHLKQLIHSHIESQIVINKQLPPAKPKQEEKKSDTIANDLNS